MEVMTMADMWVEALVSEREGYQRDPRKAHKVMAVDDELARHGYGVDSKGDLVKLAKVEPEKAEPVKRPAREHAVSKAPERAVDKD